MRRYVVCLLIALASTGAVARESKLSDADGGSCPTQGSRQTTVRPIDRGNPLPVPGSPAKATTTGGDDAGPRLQSPRWHRFLPGMFR